MGSYASANPVCSWFPPTCTLIAGDPAGDPLAQYMNSQYEFAKRRSRRRTCSIVQFKVVHFNSHTCAPLFTYPIDSYDSHHSTHFEMQIAREYMYNFLRNLDRDNDGWVGVSGRGCACESVCVCVRVFMCMCLPPMVLAPPVCEPGL